MASDGDWIAETVGDFIHSRIWLAPIYTFIEHNCLSFDYEDENDGDSEHVQKQNREKLKEDNARALREEQLKVYEKYQQLVDSLIGGLGHDLSLDKELLTKACTPSSNSDSAAPIDESYEQLYAARNFSIFQEMMRRRNLILQLQALVALQLHWGLLKPSETGEDLVLSLLLQATSPSTHSSSEQQKTPGKSDSATIRRHDDDDQRGISNRAIEQVDHDDDDDVQVVETRTQVKPKKKVEPKKPAQEVRKLADLRRRPEVDAEWHRKLRNDFEQEETEESPSEVEPSQKLSEVPQDVLREKLRQLSIRTSQMNPEAAAALNSRSEFLRQQRDLLLKKQGSERKQDIEQQARNARPQSAAYAANRAMANMTIQGPSTPAENQPQLSSEELEKRQAIMKKLRNKVVDKH